MGVTSGTAEQGGEQQFLGDGPVQIFPNRLDWAYFLKGLAELEIDKSLIANGRVLTVLAHKWSRQDTQSDADTTCNSCHKYIYISHLSTCPVCMCMDKFLPEL
jgi:hypothetical protein